MVVDDEVSIRDGLKGFLEDYGYDVVVAGTAEEALAYISEPEFLLAIIDLRLHRMNGETLTRRASQLSPEMRFIIYTGLVDILYQKNLFQSACLKKMFFINRYRTLSLLLKGKKNSRQKLKLLSEKRRI